MQLSQLAYDLNYGGIVGISRSEAGSVSVDSSDESDVYLSASEFEDSYYQEASPSEIRRESPDGQQKQGSTSPSRGPAPEPVDHPLAILPIEEEGEEELAEEEEAVCKCCTSWYDWCLFLSCKLTVLVSPLRMPLRERKCLRRARTEGWRLLWSLVFPLAVGSVRMQLVWVIAQLVTSFVVCSLSYKYEYWPWCCEGWSLVCFIVSVIWVVLTLMDTIVCLVAVQFYRNKFVWVIGPYITVLRIIYSAICLHIVVVGFHSSIDFVYYAPSNISFCSIYFSSKLSKAQFGLYFASLCVFVDLMLLVVTVQFTHKSLRLRNTYTETHGQPSNRDEGVLPFHVAFELAIHLLMVSCAIHLIFFAPVDCYCGDGTGVSCCYYVMKMFNIIAGVYTGLSVTMPLIGLLKIYFIDFFCLQKYLASICLSVQNILQDRDTVARLGIPENVCEKLQEMTQEIDLDLLQNSIKSFEGEATFRHKLVHLCENPFSVIYSHFLFIFIPATTVVVVYAGFFDFFNVSFHANLFTIVATVFADIMFLIIHIHIIVFPCITIGSCFFLPIALLLWPLCSSQNSGSHTRCCKTSLVP